MKHTHCMPLDPLLHAQRRVARPHGVIFVSEGSAEQRHDAVARRLVDSALIVMNGFHH